MISILTQRMQFELFEKGPGDAQIERVNDIWPPRTEEAAVGSDIEDALSALGIELIGKYLVTIEPIE